MPTPDFTKSPQQIATDLINNANGTSLVEGMLSFGFPTPIHGPFNTQIIATATPYANYSGAIVINYNRVNLSIVPGARSVLFELGLAVNVSDLIPMINMVYGINLTPGDYVNAPLPTFTNGQTQNLPFQVVADVSSLIFIGALNLLLTRGQVPLSSILTVTALNGLVYTPPSP